MFLFFSSLLYAQSYTLHKVNTNSTASFRGLSVVDNNVAWVSGSLGQVGRTTDGGKSWTFNTVEGFEKSEFRSLYAFDSERAIIANAGSPGYILLTTNGGKNWKTIRIFTHKDTFFDGIDFWNDREGILYGDPVEGKMFLLRTSDGGLTWKEVSNPPMLETGEASFAASGTGIRCTNEKLVTICTGGTVSRLWISQDKGDHWTAFPTPIIQGKSTTGIFSFTQNENRLMIVGGDFKEENSTRLHHFYSTDSGRHWLVPTAPARGYRECIEAITKNVLIAAGPSGVDISYDNGDQWNALSNEKELHTVRKARKGSLVIAAGGNGKLFLIR